MMNRMTIWFPFFVLVNIFSIGSTYAQQQITSIDFYGIRRLSASKINQAIGIQKDQGLKISSKELKEKIKNINGVEDCDVVRIRYPGNFALFIGIQEEGTKPVKFRKAPTGDIRLEPGLIEHYDSIMELLLPAIRSGKSGEDQSSGHSISKYPPMKEKQVQLIPIANKQYSVLVKVLKESSDAKSRAAAAYILAYADKKPTVAKDLSYACSDPNSLVRNNAVRALGLLAKFGKKNPSAKLVISYQPFLQMLKSLKWTDRNKGAAFFDSMTLDCEKKLLNELAKGYLAELEEMARWKSSGHSFFSIRILARIAGLGEKEILSRCKEAKTDPLRQKLVDDLLKKIEPSNLSTPKVK